MITQERIEEIKYVKRVIDTQATNPEQAEFSYDVVHDLIEYIDQLNDEHEMLSEQLKIEQSSNHFKLQLLSDRIKELEKENAELKDTNNNISYQLNELLKEKRGNNND